MKLLILFGLVVLATGSPVNLPAAVGPMASTGHVVGGEVTPIQEVPHQVSIQASGSHICGGSIISPDWVLTAAHCVEQQRSYSVRAGTDRLDADHGTLHTLAEIIVHEDFKTSIRGIPSNDIAILRVKEPFKVDETRQPTPLYESGEESVAGVHAKISGWGRTTTGEIPYVLYAATVPIVSKSDCDKAYASFGGLPPGQVCAAYPEGGVDTCQGDSGGPMTIDGRQAGIVSWGNGCGSPGYPGAYTEVAYYRDWIRKNAKF